MEELISPASTRRLNGPLLPGELRSAGPYKSTLRLSTWRLTSGAHKSWAAALFSTSIMGLIFANVVLVVVDTEPSMNSEVFSSFYRSFEWASLVIFAAEYLVRLWSCVEDPALRHVQSSCRACAGAPQPWPPTLARMGTLTPPHLASLAADSAG
jgi:hypothetical protein